MKRLRKTALVILVIASLLTVACSASTTTSTPSISSAAAATTSASATAISTTAKASTTTSGTTATSKPNENLGKYTLKYQKHEIIKDYQKNPALAVYSTFTNNSDKGTSYMMAIIAKAFQKGIELEPSIVTSKAAATENNMKEIKPGVTIDVCSVYKLTDTTSDVEFEASELLSFSDETVMHTIKLSSTSTNAPQQTSKTPAATTASTASGNGDDAIGSFVVKYLKHEVIKDYENKPAVAVFYRFTNNSDKTESFMTSVMTKAFQKGIQLEIAMIMKDIPEYTNSMKDLRPGASIDVCSVYTLGDVSSDVEIEISEFSFVSTKTITKVIELK